MNTIAVPVSTEPPQAILDSSRRCQSTSADGRRCTMPSWEGHPTLCIPHARAEAKARTSHQQIPSRLKDSDDEPAEAFDFTPSSGDFHTATDVNRALGKIFILLAQNRIPRRKAVALGYLGQLLLQTLPQVREEINECLGYKAWAETLESAFYEEEPEEETAAPEDKNETKLGTEPSAEGDAEAILRSAGLQPGMPSAVADGPARNTHTETAAVAGAALEDQTDIEVQEEAPQGTPISTLAETTEPTGVGSAQTELCATGGGASRKVAQMLVCGSCSQEPDSTAPVEPEAANTPTETAPETSPSGFTYQQPWQPTGSYTGLYNYWEEPAVKEEFLRKYGRPIEEANIPPSRLKRVLTPVMP